MLLHSGSLSIIAHEAVTASQTSRIFESMVRDLVMDATLASHQEVARSRAVCHICHTRCVISLQSIDFTSFTRVYLDVASVSTLSSWSRSNLTPLSDHQAGPSNLSVPLASSSRHPTPDVKALNASNGTGASTPTSVKDATAYFECLNCKRQVRLNTTCLYFSSLFADDALRLHQIDTLLI